jgi:methyl-accepting chemotaxis protein WspA
MSQRWNSLSLTRSGISTQLLIWFLLISLIPCGILTAVISYLSTDSLKKSVKHGLVAISDAKTTQLNFYVRERRADLALLSRTPTVIQAIEILGPLRRAEALDSPAYREAERKIRPPLAHFAEAFGYKNYHLFAIDGTVLFRLKTEPDPGSNLLKGKLSQSELAEVFERVRTLLQSEISDFQHYEGQTEPIAFIATPVFDTKGLLIGVAALELDNEHVFHVFKDYNGLGRTGEAMVTVRNGSEFTLVAPPRHDPNEGMKYHGRIGDTRATAMQRAVQGQHGYDEAIDFHGHPVVAAWSYLPAFRWGMVVKQDTEEAFELIDRQRAAVILLLLLTITAVTAVALWLARAIAQPIREAAFVTDRIASGDLTVDCRGEAPGEPGLLLQSIRKMIQDLRSLIGKIQRSSITLLSTATEISAASRQQEQAVQEYSASTNQAAAAVNQISATSQELLKTMNEVNDVADQTSEMASTGQQSLAGMDRTMRQLAESTGSISSKLSVISERAANINLVVTTITKVADQTNLLSINAAIEAEKAGEYGLGFLVVAREIRRLADMTAVSTLDIERMVKEMQYSVSAGVMEMDKFTEQVKNVVGEVERIGGQLSEIISGVKGLNERFDQVTEGMRVQSQGADQIREAMARVSESASQSSQSIREFNRATERLRDAVGGLKDEVAGFVLGTPDLSQTPLPMPRSALNPPL